MALVEAGKGVLVLIVGLGMLRFAPGIEGVALDIMSRLHLNPARRIPHAIIEALERPTPDRRAMLPYVAGMVAYSVLKVSEGVGLWRQRTWALWLGIVAEGLFIPAEIRHAIRTPTAPGIGLLGFNVAFVGLLIWTLRAERRGIFR